MQNQNQLAEKIEYARKLHGHVGPYLVIGLKMGAAAKAALNMPDIEQMQLKAEVNVPLQPPTSCLLDGIQVSTTCTVGNQRLQFKNAKTIYATFKTKKDSKTAKITLKEQFQKELEQKLKLNLLEEPFAWEISERSEDQLFDVILE
jgi:formylmethanofuran dehydrogenase subunit E